MLTPHLIIQGNDYSVDMIQFSNKEDSIYILEPVKTQRTWVIQEYKVVLK